MESGTLKRNERKDKKGNIKVEFLVEFVNAKGKTLQMAILPQYRFFDEKSATDGDPVEFEYMNGQVQRCMIPGKPGLPSQKEGEKVSHPASDSGTSLNTSHRAHRTGNRGALCDAVAPYNFVPFDADAVIPAFEDEERFWSGTIVYSLTALTPLLICGKQTKATGNSPALCRFMKLHDKNILPGTSIKGMLRSLLGILTFSNLERVSDKHLFWRTVNRSEYRKLFSQDEISGGFLRKNGAEYKLLPTTVVPKPFNTHQISGLRVETGGFPVRGGGKSCVYDFHPPSANTAPLEVKKEIIDAFWAQLTPNQESQERWNKERRQKYLDGYDYKHGLPVFYRLDEDGNIAELGFCRYFRLKYKYTPHDLAYPQGCSVPMDFVTGLFGSAGNDKGSSKFEAFKGRISVETSIVNGHLYKESGIDVVLGGPKPTCLPLYLVQNPQSVKTMSGGKKNDPEKMASYNDAYARLRGHKLYWHHDVDKAFFPGKDVIEKGSGKKNLDVITRLFPLDSGASATVVIHVDRLTTSELGALLEAIQLPEGHAHKIGMGKSLGFGSVRLEIAEARIGDIRNLHRSLSARLSGSPEILTQEKMEELRSHFRKRVLAAVKTKCKKWSSITEYDSLEPIRTLRIMMDYKNRPAPVQVRTMTLGYDPDDPLTKVNFSTYAILPSPEEIMNRR